MFEFLRHSGPAADINSKREAISLSEDVMFLWGVAVLELDSHPYPNKGQDLGHIPFKDPNHTT